jgi:hypothetical protein
VIDITRLPSAYERQVSAERRRREAWWAVALSVVAGVVAVIALIKAWG